MKKLITTASLCLLMSNFLVAQEKTKSKSSTAKTEKIAVKKEKKEPCFTSEFDAEGKEIKVPCGTKSKAVTVASNTKKLVPVHTEFDHAGKEKNYVIDFDKDGKEIKTYVNLLEEFDATGKSILYFKQKLSSGKEVVVPAERK